MVRDGVQIKIEPNQVIRGSLLSVVDKTLSSLFEQQTDTQVTVTCLAHHELYAGKLCAALYRQHPRDFFDVWIFLQQCELSAEFMNIFIIYLISQRRPICEGLQPNIRDLEPLYHNQFIGMTDKEVALEKLCEVQQSLPCWIVSSMTEDQRNFLLGFKRGEPDWSLLPHPDAKTLPAVRWKQQNLDRMNAEKRQAAVYKLQQLFKTVPYNPKQVHLQMQRKTIMSQALPEQLASEIIDELINRGLLDKSKQQKLQQKITSGSIKSEDWSLLIKIDPGDST